MPKKTRQQEIDHETNYVSFLEKRLASENYRKNTPAPEVSKEKQKLDKARFRLRILTETSKRK